MAYLVSLTPLGSRTLRIGIELDTLFLILGIAFSFLLVGVVLIRFRETNLIKTTRVRSENEAAEERRRFLRRLDHELKNPLMAIRAGLANLPSSGGEKQVTDVETSIESQILRLSRLTSDLRKLADLETQPLEERSGVDMEELLQEAFEAAKESPSARERTLSLIMPQAPWPLPQVLGDRDLLFLGFFNLLDNALKFTGQGDTVELRAFEDGANVVVEVADTGIGIPAGEIHHVWEELFRGQEARGVPGSGLGLSLVKAIVERHGGRTELRSKSDQGTVIVVRLPKNSVVSDP
jgi:two-component system OmpR family sensor kinase